VSDNGVDLHGWTGTVDNIGLWWTGLWLAGSLVATRNSVVRVNSSEPSLASLKLFSSSSAFSGVTAGVLVEFVFSHHEGTDVPRFLADSLVIGFVDDGGDWNDFTVVLATEYWWNTRLQDLATSTGIGFVDSSFSDWAEGDYAEGFFDTFADFFEAWTFVVVFQVVSESLGFDLGRASVARNIFLEWTRNIIATVLAGPVVTTTVEAVFVTEIDGAAILKILANSWNMFNSWYFTVDEYTSVPIASVFRSPFVTDWVLDTVVFTKLFSTVRVADATGVSFALVSSFVGWGASQMVATWTANWGLFNAFITEVTHDDATFAGTFGS